MSADYSERTVRIGGIQYRDPRGVWRFGLQGAKVHVHPDNVERFDKFNGDPSSHVEAPEPTVPEPVSAPEPVAPIAPAPREPAAETSAPESAPEPEEPKRRGPGRPRKSEQDHG